MKFAYTFIFVIVVAGSTAQQKSIQLVNSSEKAFVVYKNADAMIRISYVDLINEIENLEKTRAFRSLDQDHQKQIDRFVSYLRIYYRENQQLGVVKHGESDPFGYLFTKTIGPSLMLQGKAAIWIRRSLKQVEDILVQVDADSTHYFFFPDNQKPFFVGRAFTGGALQLDGDSLMFNLHEPVRGRIVTGESRGTPVQYAEGSAEFKQFISREMKLVKNAGAEAEGVYVAQAEINDKGRIVDVKMEGPDKKMRNAFARMLYKSGRWLQGTTDGIHPKRQFKLLFIVNFDNKQLKVEKIVEN
jgi:hypothetical protein